MLWFPFSCTRWSVFLSSSLFFISSTTFLCKSLAIKLILIKDQIQLNIRSSASMCICQRDPLQWMEHHQDKFLCTFLNVTGEQISLHPCMHVHFRNEVQCMRDFRSSQLGKVYDFLSFQGGKMYDFISSQPGKVHEFICSEWGKLYDFISSQRCKVHEIYIFSAR